jgi:hypothetical protein
LSSIPAWRAGVDRWSRSRLMVLAEVLRASAAAGLLALPGGWAR